MVSGNLAWHVKAAKSETCPRLVTAIAPMSCQPADRGGGRPLAVLVCPFFEQGSDKIHLHEETQCEIPEIQSAAALQQRFHQPRIALGTARAQRMSSESNAETSGLIPGAGQRPQGLLDEWSDPEAELFALAEKKLVIDQCETVVTR